MNNNFYRHFSSQAVEAIFFDVDGTLLKDEAIIHEAIVREMKDILLSAGLVQEALKLNAAACMKRFAARDFKGIYEAFCSDMRLDSGEYPYQVFEGHVFENLQSFIVEKPLSLTSCTDDLLDFITNVMDVPIGLASNGVLRNINLVVKNTSLKHYFSAYAVTSSDMVQAPKPSPDMLFLLADHFELGSRNLQNTIYVGNAPADMIAARAAGMWPIGVVEAADAPKRQELKKSLYEAGAAIVFDRLEGVYGMFISLHQRTPHHAKVQDIHPLCPISH